jgi:6-phosphofructokinase 1
MVILHLVLLYYTSFLLQPQPGSSLAAPKVPARNRVRVPSCCGPVTKQRHSSPSSLASTDGDTNTVEECDLEDEASLEACLSRQGYQTYNPTNPAGTTIQKVYVAQLETLQSRFAPKNVPNHKKRSHNNKNNNFSDETAPTSTTSTRRTSSPSSYNRLQYSSYMSDDDIVLVDVVRRSKVPTSISRAFVRGGPREFLHFDPTMINAAIVTCGGLCPGLNTVVRELTHALYRLYGVQAVYGIRGGYRGFHNAAGAAANHLALLSSPQGPVLLTLEMVENIHHDGGSFLKTSRGGFDLEQIIEFLTSRDIGQLYIVGGDGTHRGAYAIHQECRKRNLNIAIAGIPKTIDNDVDYIDRSFGFLSAVEAAQASIR